MEDDGSFSSSPCFLLGVLRSTFQGVGAGVHNSPFKMMCVVNFAISYTPLLDGLRQSPMFRNLVQIDLRADAREVCQAIHLEFSSATHPYRWVALQMLDAIHSLQAQPQVPEKEEDDWRSRLRSVMFVHSKYVHSPKSLFVPCSGMRLSKCRKPLAGLCSRTNGRTTL